MMRFVHQPDDLAESARKIVAESKAPRIAVAFWGTNTIEHLGLVNTEKCKFEEARIVMNLSAGGTNGSVVEQLLDAATELNKLGRRVLLRQCDRLHAKVWIGDKCALVSSANASVFGLSFHEITTRNWKEAGVLIDDPKIVAEIRDWFDNLWSDPSLDEIGRNDARRCPRKGPVGPPITRNKTISLSDICGDDDCPIRLTFIHGNLTVSLASEKAAKRQKEKLKQAGFSPVSISKLQHFEIDPAIYKYKTEWSPRDIAIEISYYSDRKNTIKKLVVGSRFLRCPDEEFSLYDKLTKTNNSYAWDVGNTANIKGYGKVKFDANARIKIKAALSRRLKNKPFSYVAYEGMLLWELFK
jgi:hypothetical protein